MDKTIRCTVCTWRGPWSDAASVSPPRPSQLPPELASIDAARQEKQQIASSLGSHSAPPSCPVCGHATLLVRMHSIKPAGM